MKTIKVKRRDYISASQINSFIERRDQFIRNYVLGQSFIGNSSFGRGKAIELGVDVIIDGMDYEDAANLAWKTYLRYCDEEGLSKSESAKITEKEIRESVVCAGKFYREDLKAGEGVEKQKKISLELDEIDKPIIGYTDYIFPATPFSKGPVRDLKTAAKTPSYLSPGYKLQGTVYRLATGKNVIFDYVVNLKGGSKVKSIQLTDEDVVEYKPIIIAVAKYMEKFWSFVPDEIDEDCVDAFRALGMPNFHGFWNADERAQAIAEWV